MRRPKVVQHLSRAAVAVLGASVLVGVLPARVLAAEPDLSCAGTRPECRVYSTTLLDAMDTLAPGGSGYLAEQLATGYMLDASTTVTCKLGVDCDAWPVAVAAATTLGAPGSACALGAASVCDAVRLATSTVDTAPALELTEILGRVAAASLGERAAALEAEVERLMARVPDGAAGAQFAGTVVGVIVLAVNLLPGGVVDSPVPPEQHATGVEVVVSSGGGLVACGSAGQVPCAGGDLLRDHCGITLELFSTLKVRDGYSWDTFIVDAFAGVNNVKWADWSIDHSSCPEFSAIFVGSIFAEAHSNGGYVTGIPTSSKRSKLRQHRKELSFEYAASTWIEWETGKANVEWNFPKDFGMHYYAPPAGKYLSEAVAHIELTPAYQFLSDKRSYRSYAFHCVKQGYAESYCWHERTDG